MVGIVAMTTVFTVGIAFYVRFFIALCKDSHHTWIGYFVRIEPGESDEAGEETRRSPIQLSVGRSSRPAAGNRER